MSNVGAGFGPLCPNCGTSIDIHASAGTDVEKCPKCGTKMIPNPNARVSAGVTCKNCNSSFGIINSDKCPNCGTPFE